MNSGIAPLAAQGSQGPTRRRLLSALAIGAVFASERASADSFEVPPSMCPARPIHLAHFEFGNFYSNGRGLESDILAEMKQRSGCAFASVSWPRARIWVELERGSLDMAMSAIPAPERDRYAWFIPYFKTKNYVIAGPSMPKHIDSAEAFLNAPTLRWGAVRGFRHGAAYDDFIGALAKQGRLELVASSQQLFDMLRADRFAGMLSTPIVYRKELGQAMPAGWRVQDWAPASRPIVSGLMLSRMTFSQTRFAAWRLLINSMIEDGSLRKIARRYLPADELDAALFDRAP